MRKRSCGLLIVVFIIAGILFEGVDGEQIEAAGTVYIRATGEVEGTNRITTLDNITYTFIDSLNDSIIVERSHIVIDGAGHSVSGPGSGYGFCIEGAGNVTIRHCIIRDFATGVYLNTSPSSGILGNTISGSSEYGIYVHESSDTLISTNDLRNNFKGIEVRSSSSTTISGNSVEAEALYNDYAIKLDRCWNGTVSHNTIASNDEGVYLANSSWNTISQNGITDNYYGIIVADSSNNTISGNHITNDEGVRLRFASNNLVRGNNISGNGNHGLWLFHSSSNILSGNTLNGNRLGGLWLSSSSNNLVSGNHIEKNTEAGIYIWGQNNTLVGNTLTNNDRGVWLEGAHNMFIHNNFMANTPQVYASTSGELGRWDDGREGNYWSDYAGVDLNHDGIGDSWYDVADNTTDRYPLMGYFHRYSTSVEELVNVVSNSTVTQFNYTESTGWITIQVRNTSAEQTGGFCRVTVPHDLIDPDVAAITIVINTSTIMPLHFNDSLYDNSTHRWIYVAYPHSLVDITIVAESLGLMILPMLLIAALLVAARAYRSRHEFKAS